MTTYLIQLIFGTTLLLHVAIVVNGLCCRAAASLRYRVWTFTLLGLLVLPVLSPLLPTTYLAGTPRITVSQPIPPAPIIPSQPVTHTPPLIISEPTPVPVQTISTTPQKTAIRYDYIACTVWLFGTFILLVHLLASIRGAKKMVASLESMADPVLNELSREFGVKQPVRLLLGRADSVPFICGMIRPTIVLPPQSLSWSEPEKRAVLTHELAHVVRGDLFWQLVTQIVCAVYWFHPLVWLAAWRIWVERESACDDIVVLRGEKPSIYADILVELARKLMKQKLALPGCTVAITRKNKVGRRIKAILNPGRRRIPLGRLGTAVLLGVAIGVIALTATMSPFAQPLRETADGRQQTATEEHEPVAGVENELKFGENAKEDQNVKTDTTERSGELTDFGTVRLTTNREPPPTSPSKGPGRKVFATKTIMATTVNPFDVSTYPEGFAEIERIVKENNGLALIARVVDADGNPINRADIHTGSHYEPALPDLNPFASFSSRNGGWMRTNNILTTLSGRMVLAAIEAQNVPDRETPIKFFVFTAKNKPIAIDVPITPGNVYYAEIVIPKTPEDELVSVSGTIMDTEDNPIGNVSVGLRVRDGRGATANLRQTTADTEGRFTFDKVAQQSYLISANVIGYTPVLVEEISAEATGKNHLLRYYKTHDVEIEYVYQPDGGRDFTQGNLQPRTVTLKAMDYTKGFHFETGEMYSGGARVPHDIAYGDNFGNLAFHQRLYHRTLGNGFYDAGEVPFESITEADARPEAYPRPLADPLPAKLNHVYVVKTIDGNYVKFIVRKIIPAR